MISQLSKASRLGIFSLTAASLFMAQATWAQDFSAVEIKTEKVTGNIYMLTGRGGNIGVSAGSDGIFIVDDQFAPLTDKIKSAIGDIQSGDIDFVINTHWHSDHTGGNENLGKAGTTIVAHDRVRARMQQGGRDLDFRNPEPEASVPDSLPVITYNDELGLHLNGDAVRIYHAPRGHTDGDSIVHFPSSNVLHLGDLYFSTGYPFVDRDSGGSLQGVIRAIKFALRLSDNDTKIIPGHGPLADRSDLQRYYDMLVGVRDAVQSHIDRGHDLKQTMAAKPTSQWDEAWGEYFISGDQITVVAWQSLSLDYAHQKPRRQRHGHGHQH